MDRALSFVKSDGGPTRLTDTALNLALPNVLLLPSICFESCVVDTDMFLAIVTLASITFTRFLTALLLLDEEQAMTG